MLPLIHQWLGKLHMNSISYKRLLILTFSIFFCFYHNLLEPFKNSTNKSEYITIAILAKDKAHTLPLYLHCIEQQTWPKYKTYLYIRTNNNSDETIEILQNWITRVGSKYAKIYFDDTDVDETIEQFGQHEWNYTRLRILGKIRQDSIDWAYRRNSHYFVADCDNFIYPDTLQSMVDSNQPIVAPLLLCNSKPLYSNYHYAIDCNGYYAQSIMYYHVLNQDIRGLIEVPVVHCTYFIRHEVLDKVTYDDDSWRYEYVIFSDSARKNNIPQYIDSRKVYGYISFAENSQEFNHEPFIDLFAKQPCN